MSTAPIGLFDSGIGGLSIARAVAHLLPHEALLYVADAAHCPYGPRPPAEIQRLSTEIARYLLEQGAKAIVVACNTASAAALATLRRTYAEVPIVGMVPAVKPAAQYSRTGVVGVLATPGTLKGQLYGEVVEHWAAGVRVLSSACDGLVERIEAGELDDPATEALVRACVAPMLAAGADTLVLGCTHYPLIAPLLRRVVGEAVQLIEPSAAVARQTERVLAQGGLLAPPRDGAPDHRYGTTGEVAVLRRAVQRLVKMAGEVESLAWRDGHLTRFG